MASNNIYKQTGYFIYANSKGKQIIDQIRNQLKKDVDKLGEQLLQKVCEKFVQLAQYNLLSAGKAYGYHVNNLVENIVATKYGKNKYRIGIKNNNEKPIMYFLEFGTGVVGRDNPHPKASEIGWQYLVTPRKSKSGKPLNGWSYYDEERDEWVFTRGLRALSYIYDTMQQMPEIIKQAKKEVGFSE